MRRASRLAIKLCCSALPLLCAANAAGRPHWSRVDFTESTHLGPVRVMVTTTGAATERRIDRIRIWANGHELRVPGAAGVHVMNPDLHEASLTYTASYICLDDACPDIRTWSAPLIIPFGDEVRWEGRERPVSNSCDQSFLAIDILADRVSKVAIYECGPTGTDSRWIDIFAEK